MGKNNGFYDYTKEDMVEVLKEITKLWHRKVTAYDSRVVEDMFLDYAFPPATIRYLFNLAYKRGAESPDYIYAIADVLKGRNITDATEAELTLERSFKKYTDILVYISGKRRIPSPAEKKKIDDIMMKYHPTEEEIEEIGKITEKAQRPSLAYFEAVLRNKKKLT